MVVTWAIGVIVPYGYNLLTKLAEHPREDQVLTNAVEDAHQPMLLWMQPPTNPMG